MRSFFSKPEPVVADMQMATLTPRHCPLIQPKQYRQLFAPVQKNANVLHDYYPIKLTLRK